MHIILSRYIIGDLDYHSRCLAALRGVGKDKNGVSVSEGSTFA